MTFEEILSRGSSGILLILTLIQLAPIKINPWAAIGKWIGKTLNHEVLQKTAHMSDEIERLESSVKDLRGDWEAREAYLCRVRILRFGDEMLRRERHSKEHFDQVLIDIAEYEQYCEKNKNFRNGVAVATIQRIKDVYMDRLENNDFLCSGRRKDDE